MAAMARGDDKGAADYNSDGGDAGDGDGDDDGGGGGDDDDDDDFVDGDGDEDPQVSGTSARGG